MSIEIKKYFHYVLIVLLISFLIVKGIIPGWTRIHSDFSNYYISAKLISDHVSIDRLYDNAWFYNQAVHYGSAAPGKFAPFPPITAWVMLPLTSFDILIAQRIFVIVNFLFLALGIYTIKKITSLSWLESSTLFLLGGWGLVNNFSFGQLYLIMVVCLLIAYRWIVEQKFIASGILLSVFTAIKYFPIVIAGGQTLELFTLIGSFKRKQIQLVITFALTLILLLVAQYVFFGTNLMSEFFKSAFLPHLDGRLTGQGLYSFEFQSWDGLLRNLFVLDQTENLKPFIDWAEGKTIFKSFLFVLIAASMFYTLYNHRNKNDYEKQMVFLTVPALAALVVLPASATYHFILLIFPLAILLSSDLLEKRIKTIVLVLYTFVGFIPYGMVFKIAHSLGVIFAYPRLWLITSIYLVVLYGLWKTNRIA